MACDGRLSTKWCIDDARQMPYSIVLDAGSQTSLTGYGLVTGDDTHSYPSRNPVTWRVSGSNDKQAWTVIDEQKYNRRLRDENEQEYRFKPAVKGQFRYYRCRRSAPRPSASGWRGICNYLRYRDYFGWL